jgi:hypothetical protein
MGIAMRKLVKLPPACLPMLVCMLPLVSCTDQETAAVREEKHTRESGVTLISNARIYTFDAGSTVLESGSMIELYQQKIAEGSFPVRVYAMANGMNETTRWLCEEGPLNDPSGRLVARPCWTTTVTMPAIAD